MPASTSGDNGIIAVGIGCWAVAQAPTQLRSLLGSCVAVVLHDRITRAGALAHILLPDSTAGREVDQPGKYADTAVPLIVSELEKKIAQRARSRFAAKLLGGATMFATAQTEGIGERNGRAAEQALAALGIPILARDLGGQAGRRVTVDLQTGRVQVKIPGGAEYEI